MAGEEIAVLTEPQPLGAEIDPAAAELWQELIPQVAFEDLYALLVDPVVTNPCLRQRLVTVLTAPVSYGLPYDHPNRSLYHTLRMTNSSLRLSLAGQSETANELAKGVLFWLDRLGLDTIDLSKVSKEDAPDDFTNMITYIEAIKELIPLVDETEAYLLFMRLGFKEPGFYTQAADREQKRWSCAEALLIDEQIPREYKQMILNEWKALIESSPEHAIIDPDAKKPSAMQRLINVASNWINRSQEEPDKPIYQGLIGYIEQHLPKGTAYLSAYIGEAANLIDNGHLRTVFLHRHIFNPNFTRIRDEDELEAVVWFRETAGDLLVDTEQQKLDLLIAEWHEEQEYRATEAARRAESAKRLAKSFARVRALE